MARKNIVSALTLSAAQGGKVIVTFSAVQVPTHVCYSTEATAIIWRHKDSTKPHQSHVCIQCERFLKVRKL